MILSILLIHSMLFMNCSDNNFIRILNDFIARQVLTRGMHFNYQSNQYTIHMKMLHSVLIFCVFHQSFPLLAKMHDAYWRKTSSQNTCISQKKKWFFIERWKIWSEIQKRWNLQQQLFMNKWIGNAHEMEKMRKILNENCKNPYNIQN